MDQINSVIDKLAEKLGVATNAIYPYLIKQAIVNGIVDVVLCALAVLFTIGFIYGIKKVYFDKFDKNDEDENALSFYDAQLNSSHRETIVTITIVLALIEIGLIFGFFIWASDAITALINPQYYALRDLLSMLKK
jgi:hypothetical protein